jgi:hypothetical protein
MALLFFDDFDYVINRTGTGQEAAFVSNGGWTGAKLEQDQSSANILMYTVSSIPGFAGTFPGAGSHALCMESIVGQQGQSDGYLQLGFNTDDFIPPNVWFQYWVYHQNDAGSGQESLWVSRSKWIYATNESGGAYPSHSHRWMISLTSVSGPPLYILGGDDTPAEIPNLVLASAAGLSTIAWTGPGFEVGDNDSLGPQNTTERLVTNRWTLVKMNIDTSTMTPRYRLWLRAQGDPDFTLVSDWQHGVNDLSWTYASAGGHKAFRWPSTLGDVSEPHEDAWIYFQDFAMADAEADLPTYDDEEEPSSAILRSGQRAGGWL